MKVWAIADLHLSFSVPDKSMEVFGDDWFSYQERIQKHWHETISADDLVLIAGDISWAKHLEEAMIDLEWIDQLPGKKIISKGNHDYWWPSNQKLHDNLPSSISFIHNNALLVDSIAIAGTRLWDCPEVNYSRYIEIKEHPKVKKRVIDLADKRKEDEKIFTKEMLRLQRSLAQMSSTAETKIAMLHYPPLSPENQSTSVTALLEQYGVHYCVYGHLHNLRPGLEQIGSVRGIHYLLTSADYLNFKPLRIL